MARSSPRAVLVLPIVEKRTPVDPDRTLFRPGSVSKLVTWTAAMQLVEQGKLDLDKDINAYLDFKIPEYDGKPITLRQLMTHTAGFEEAVKDIIFTDPAHLLPLGDYLKRWTPTRVFEPGTTPAYSNWATALTGYIVERVSGETFDDYCDKHIFAPLGMTNSTMRQPLPAALAGQMASGYKPGQEAGKFEIIGPAPAGSLSATGTDMAKFMLAHLDHGKGLLSPEAAAQMQNAPLDKFNPVSLLPPLNRMRLGFFETNINGREVIGHLGDTEFFHTSLHLLMKEGVGIYFSFNSGGREGQVQTLRWSLFEDFADRYFPASTAAEARPDGKTAAEHAAMMAGNWQVSRTAWSNPIAVLQLIGQTKVAVGPKGGLLIPELLGANKLPREWEEIAPFVWREKGGHDLLAAKVENGKVVRWSFGLLAPFMVFDRVPAHRSSGWIMPAASVSLGVLLLTVLFWPIALVRAAQVPRDVPARRHRAARLQVDALGIVARADRPRGLGGDDRGAVRQSRKPLGYLRRIAVGAANRRRDRLHRRRRDCGMERLVDLARWASLDGEGLEHADRGFFGRSAVRGIHLQPRLDDGELLMSGLKFDVAVETLRLAQPFRISGYCFETADVVYVTLDDGTHRGRGEASGVYYMRRRPRAHDEGAGGGEGAIEAGPTRQELREILPPGGARAAVDAALWELEALRAGTTAWRLAGLTSVHPVRTTFTVSADTVEAMTARAVKYAGAKAIKVKLTGEVDLDLARVRAIRAARPDVWLGVDANQGYSIGKLPALVRGLCEQRVLLLEQPLPRGREADLEGFDSPIPIAADESVLSLEELPRAVGRFDVVNIKLDKCGGLTEGLMMAEEARRLGLGVMVGTMVGTSLATAPAFILAQLCDRRSRRSDLPGERPLAGRRLPRRQICLPATKCGVRRAPSPHDEREDLVRPSARPDRPVPHEHVGAVLLLRHARAAGLLHDQAAADGAGTSSFIYGIYTGCAYFTPIIGGVIADRWLGKKRAIIIGGSVMALGHFMMAFEPLFYVALATIALGNGLFLPSLPSQINDLYERGDPRAGRAYNVYYVGVNIGGFLAPLICGTLGETLRLALGLRCRGRGDGDRPRDLSLGPAISARSRRSCRAPRNPPRLREDMARDTLLLLFGVGLAVTVFRSAYEQVGNTVALWADTGVDKHGGSLLDPDDLVHGDSIRCASC